LRDVCFKRSNLATDIQVYSAIYAVHGSEAATRTTNGLLRQYMPKGIDISGYSQAS
jgi:IS30 family transposase